MAEPGGEDGAYWYQSMIKTVSNDSALSSEILEKFAQLESGEPQLRFHIKALRTSGASLDFISNRMKNNEKAQEYMNLASALSSSHEDPVKVAEMYAKSIAYALPGSRELAFAYANRSAVSFMAKDYEACLVDIGRSLENDYPDAMKANLHARRVSCLVILKKPQAEILEALEDAKEALRRMDENANEEDLVEEELNDENHVAPAPSTMQEHYHEKLQVIQDDSCEIRGATGVAIQYSEKYGRHMVATRDIRPGEIIGVVDNYAACILESCYRECAQCTEPTTSGIPCDHCVNVIYCSTSCRNEAWNDYHDLECPILGIMLDLVFSGMAILGVKITLRAVKEAGGVHDLEEMLKKIDSVSDQRVKGFTGNVLDCTKYACIYTLPNHAGKYITDSYEMSLISTFTIYYLATRTEIFGQKYPPDLNVFDKNPLMTFLGGLMIKNCEIAIVTASEVPKRKDLHFAPFIALRNHSCDSNVLSLGINKTIAIALQPIKSGEQLWDHYGGLHYSDTPRDERQQLLEDNYLFTCDCVACIENWPLLADLPSISDIPGLCPTILEQRSELEKIFWEKYNLGMLNGDILPAKDQLVLLIELLFKHARPSKELITYREKFKELCVDYINLIL